MSTRWLAHDLREGIRRLATRPRFAMFATGILALGVTASTAVFSYVNAYDRAFPGVSARGLHQVWLASEGDPWGATSYPDYLDLLELDGSGFSVTGIGSSPFAATVRRALFTEVAYGASVMDGFFTGLGVEMSAGRGFSANDHRAGAPPTVILSHAYWNARYDGSADAVGQTILLNNEPYTIVGVAGPRFLGASSAERPQFWLPFEQFLRVYRALSDTRVNREQGSVIPVLRLAEEGAAAAAEDALRTLADRLDATVPLRERSRRFVLEPATWISPDTRAAEASTARIMLAAAGFLLLLACANVANLVLSEGARRTGEMAIRRALGATSGRLATQLLAESLLLSIPAAGAALVFSGPLANRMSSYFASPSVWGANVPREILVDRRVVLFAIAAAAVSGVLAGLVPAWRASRRSPVSALRPRGASTTGAGPGRLPGTRHLLVSAQIAISMVLLFVAALVLRTFEVSRSVDAGFDTRQTLASYVSTSSMGVPVDERHLFYAELLRRFEALSWVEAATVAENAPLSGHPTDRFPRFDGGDPVDVVVARVWPGYFEALKIEMVEGRALERHDTLGATDVVVVSATLASRLGRGADVLGRQLTWPGVGDQGEDRSFEIVGVARDTRQVTLLDPPDPVAYFSLQQLYSRPGNALLLSVRDDPAVAVERMERELHDVDTRLAILNILTYRDVVGGAVYSQRMNAELFTVIAIFGLLLAAAGVFAVVALTVADRRRDIGIRMAIGGPVASIVGSVAGPIGGSVALGLFVGLLGALGATRLVGALLWGVAPIDPLALGLGAGVLTIVVGLALALPLSRALDVDPVSSLRTE